MQLRKVMQFVRLRLVPLLVSGVILVSPLSLCAEAAVWEGTATMTGYYWGLNADVRYRQDKTISLPYTNASDYGDISVCYGSQVVNGMGFATGDDVVFTSDVDVYISGYAWAVNAAGDIVSMIGDPYDIDGYEATYHRVDTDTTGEVVGSLKEITSFDPEVADEINVLRDSGIQMRVQFVASEEYPISDLKIAPVVKSGYSFAGGKADYYTNWIYPSIRVITASSSAELDELSGIADELIAQNQILSAMKGDVVALLQNIYREVGDISIATEAMRTILSALVQYVDDVENGIVEINTELDNIYSMVDHEFGVIDSRLRYIAGWLEYILDDTHTIVDQLDDLYSLVYGFLYESSGEMQDQTDNQIEQGTGLQEGLGGLQKPVYEDFDFNADDYLNQYDSSGDSAAAVSGFMGVIFGNSMITSMLMITLSFAMIAYVLYGKR